VIEETNSESRLKLTADSDFDGTMRESPEDHVKRQGSRLDIPVTVTGANAAQLPFMITKAQKEQLRRMGYDVDAINNMTPEQAHKALGVRG
jgi:RecG-like helicase